MMNSIQCFLYNVFFDIYRLFITVLFIREKYVVEERREFIFLHYDFNTRNRKTLKRKQLANGARAPLPTRPILLHGHSILRGDY